jgi:hypothetical protein
MGLLLVGSGMLWTFPPQESRWYPQCPFYAATHWLCPGCGGTRALYHLLHFELGQAFQWNALVAVCAPTLLASFLFWYYSVMRYHRSPRIHLPGGVVIAFYVVAILFAIVRNMRTGFAV